MVAECARTGLFQEAGRTFRSLQDGNSSAAYLGPRRLRRRSSRERTASCCADEEVSRICASRYVHDRCGPGGDRPGLRQECVGGVFAVRLSVCGTKISRSFPPAYGHPYGNRNMDQSSCRVSAPFASGSTRKWSHVVKISEALPPVIRAHAPGVREPRGRMCTKRIRCRPARFAWRSPCECLRKSEIRRSAGRASPRRGGRTQAFVWTKKGARASEYAGRRGSPAARCATRPPF